jgi:DNA-binding IclR family transcriptional regulator
MKSTSARAPQTSLHKALDLLSLMTGHPDGMRLYELVEYLNQPRPSVVRTLHALDAYGLVEKAGRSYRLSGRFHEWCARDRYAALRVRYRPVIEAVARSTGEMVLLGVQEGNAIIHIDVIEADSPVRVAPAPQTRHNLQTSALGKLALSRTPHLRRKVKHARLREELAQIDAGAPAWNRGETNAEVIAMADWGFSTSPTEALIAVAWPAYRFTEAQAKAARRAIRGACDRANSQAAKRVRPII